MRTLVVVAILVAAAGCDRFYTVGGTIKSCRTGSPLAGAAVDLRYPGEHGKMEAEPTGEFSVSVNDPPNESEGTLVATAPGHVSETRKVHDGDKVDICLQEEPEPPAAP